ncbi:MAG: PorP/SprF family type IX secretion system membrane protein [Saprospiraceae bacterium]|nr:PorP/SprF family type IX secretion system membrane protein [Saprospiraceae bacterium]
MNKLYTIFIACFCMVATANAQDFQLTNYQPAGMLFNPALTAAGNYTMQAGVQYRSQWASILKGYTTMGTTFEAKYKQLGFGFQLHQNHAGPASLKTTGLLFNTAYHKPLAKDGSLSLGIALGKMQRQINPVLLSFDNQYTEGVGYDAAQPSNEVFAKTKTSFADFSTGLLWQGYWGTTKNLKSSFGLSLSHVHLPNESFLGETSDLPTKVVLHGSLDMKVDNQFFLTPHFMLQKQGVHRSFLGGVRINGSFDKKSDFNAGMAYRWGDAVIIQMGLEIDDKSIWASYDANVSKLEKGTGGVGAFELGLYLRFGESQKKEMKDTDKDGVYDNRDKCPKEPGLKELQGCPANSADLDADKDGVTDEEDECPLEPGETKFNGCNDGDLDGLYDQVDACPEIYGPAENKGCPIWDRDTDKDGVADPEDHCVFIKGLPELHGCPDTDRDGVSDIDDHCPYVRGQKAYNGCPSEATAAGIEPDFVVVFQTAEATITADDKAELDAFAEQLKQAPTAKLIISGHTDNEGTVDYNYELGLRRARAVRDYLRRVGISMERMEVMSYGEVMPKRANGSHEGRAENRRTELVLMR